VRAGDVVLPDTLIRGDYIKIGDRTIVHLQIGALLVISGHGLNTGVASTPEVIIVAITGAGDQAQARRWID
jgi:hypothetical protein